jgi:hypothetical protein
MLYTAIFVLKSWLTQNFIIAHSLRLCDKRGHNVGVADGIVP